MAKKTPQAAPPAPVIEKPKGPTLREQFQKGKRQFNRRLRQLEGQVAANKALTPARPAAAASLGPSGGPVAVSDGGPGLGTIILVALAGVGVVFFLKKRKRRK